MRAQWLSAGLEALRKGGVAAVRVERLAADVGVTKGSFYHHFRDRGALVSVVAVLFAAWLVAVPFKTTPFPAVNREVRSSAILSGINDAVQVPMPWFMWNKRYVAPLYGGCQPARDFPRIFAHYLDGTLQLDALVTRTYGLDQLASALDDMLQGRNAKGVIVMPDV